MFRPLEAGVHGAALLRWVIDEMLCILGFSERV